MGRLVQASQSDKSRLKTSFGKILLGVRFLLWVRRNLLPHLAQAILLKPLLLTRRERCLSLYFVKFAVACWLSVRTVREKGSKSLGKNRKWVLEDKIQDAVWQTVLRGRRPPSAQWPRDNRSSPKANGSKADLKPKPKAQFQFGQAPPPKTGVPPPPPEEVMSAARARVAKLRTVLETLGEDDEMYDMLKASLRKAEMKAQGTSSFRTNQRHPCVHWSEVEAGGRGAAGQRQVQNSPHGSCCSARRTRTTPRRWRAQIGRTPAQRAHDAIAILSSTCSHRSRCSGGSCQDAGNH